MAAARGVPVWFLRSAGCGTDPVPVPVLDRATSLVVPADFAARPDKAASGPAVGRPTGGGGDLNCRGSVDAGWAIVPDTGIIFPLGFTPCGHFFKDEPAVCSARFFDDVFSPGFCLGVRAPSGTDGGRPHRGGMAAGVPRGKLHGFKRWEETSSFLSPIRSRKECRERRNTRYGPSYGGASGVAEPSRRTKTMSAERSSGGKLVRRWGSNGTRLES